MGGRGGIVLLVDGLHELADDERYTLDALDLLLSSHQLALQTPTRRISPRIPCALC